MTGQESFRRNIIERSAAMDADKIMSFFSSFNDFITNCIERVKNIISFIQDLVSGIREMNDNQGKTEE